MLIILCFLGIIWLIYTGRIAILNNNLLDAASRGDISKVKELLRTNVDVNAQDINGNTPLILATIAGNVTIMQDLIMAGANIYIKNKSGIDALRYVVSIYTNTAQNEEVVKLLIKEYKQNEKNISY